MDCKTLELKNLQLCTVSLTLHERTYSSTPGNDLKQQLLQIVQNCTNLRNRTITPGSQWQRVLKKRQRDQKEKINNLS